MRSRTPPLRFSCTEPAPVRLRCLPSCRCGGKGEWFVAVPWAVVDVDGGAFPALAVQMGAFLVSTVRGWHVHFPHFPASAAPVLAGPLDGDPSHARACARRGWSTERPVPSPERWTEGMCCRQCSAAFLATRAAHAATARLVRLDGGELFLDSGWRR